MNALTLPAAVHRWADLAAELGFVDFLSAEDGFRTCLASGSPWKNKDLGGVYFWVAHDGETYVGETLNARSRLLEHLRNHPDLSYACFQPVAGDNRKALETELIGRVNAVFPNPDRQLSTSVVIAGNGTNWVGICQAAFGIPAAKAAIVKIAGRDGFAPLPRHSALVFSCPKAAARACCH